MDDPNCSQSDLERMERELRDWKRDYQEALKRVPERLERFTTVSDMEIAPLYTPLDLPPPAAGSHLDLPGRYPFTRGIQHSMYRGRLWTMRLFAGLGSAEDTNRRFRYLIEQGETGLSTAFDFPTLMATTPTPLSPAANAANAAWPWTHSRTWSGCSRESISKPSRPP